MLFIFQDRSKQRLSQGFLHVFAMKRRLDARTRERCQKQRATAKIRSSRVCVTCILHSPSPIRLPKTNLTSRVWNYNTSFGFSTFVHTILAAGSMQSQEPTDDRHPRNKPVCRRKDYSESMLSKKKSTSFAAHIRFVNPGREGTDVRSMFTFFHNSETNHPHFSTAVCQRRL